MSEVSSDVAFTPAVKAWQARKGSRKAYARMEEKGGWQTDVTPELAAFLAERDSFYLASASANGQPYIQHRGGPAGFLKVVGERSLAFADFGGNKQYITAGNLSENDRAHIFLMDYPIRRRLKLWGRARVVEDAPALLESLADPAYKARPERAIVFDIEAWDVNCPQHIAPRYTEAQIKPAFVTLEGRILELEAEVARLKGVLAGRKDSDRD